MGAKTYNRRRIISITAVCIMTALICAAFIFFIGCGNDSGNNKENYSVTYSSGVGGSITGKTSQSVEYGGTTWEVIATPGNGYEFVKWSDGVETAKRTDSNVTKNIWVMAIFARKVYVLEYTAGENGSLVGETHQSVEHLGRGETVTAVPNTGYIFVKWSDGVETASRTDIIFDEDIKVTAIFARVYTLEYTAGENGSLVGETHQSVEYLGQGKTVTAVPNTGYRFVKWSDGVETAERQDSGITADINIEARFEFLFAGGQGTEASPFLIGSYKQLCDMAYYPQNIYRLICDLDLSEEKHTPIFEDERGFCGVLDGDGYTVKGMCVNDYDGGCPSLFGVLGDCTIKNLNIVDAEIKLKDYDTTAQYYEVGILAGTSYGTVKNVNISGNITAHELAYNSIAIGGMMGLSFGNINGGVINVEIRVQDGGAVGKLYIGGVSGIGRDSSICDCSTYGEIEVINTRGNINIGGLVGNYLKNNAINCLIQRCEINIDISSDSQVAVGGLFHSLTQSSNTSLYISNCVVMNNINVGTLGRVSGFIHVIDNGGDLVIEESSVKSNLTGYDSAVGFVYNIYSIKAITINDCSVVGSINTIYINATGGSGGYGAGFFYNASNVDITNCFYDGQIKSFFAAGFAIYLKKSSANNCYSNGEVTAVLSGAGFVFVGSESIFNNCHSSSDFSVTNADLDNPGRTLIGGLFLGLVNCYVDSCCFTGTIEGKVLTVGQFNIGYIAGVFVGIVINSQITNCHSVFNAAGFIPTVVGIIRNENGEAVDIDIYDNQ